MGIKAAAVRADNGHMLIRAGGDTAAAENALGIIAHQVIGAVVVDGIRHRALIAGGILHAKLLAERLQLAVVASLAGQAGFVVHREQHFERHFAGLDDLRGVGIYLHALIDRIDAGGHKGTGPLDLDNTHTARADLIEILEVAKRGDVDPGALGGLQDRIVSRHREGHAVNFDIYHIHELWQLLSYLFSIAPNLHFSMQAPHLMHFFVSIT